MKKILFTVMLLTSMSAMAQETYTNAELATEDLNGTARYVGMGGAMEALGADITTIGSNPAGVGLFRRSAVNVTAGFVSQQDAPQSKFGDATNASFDQIGFVWNTKLGDGKNLNIAFNYKKNRNFNNSLLAAGNLGGASLNKNSYMNLMDNYDPSNSKWLDAYNISQLDALYYKTFVGDMDGNLYYNNGDSYVHQSTTSGYVGEYDINVSGNVSNRVYLGLTLGFQDVDYQSWTTYTEGVVNADNQPIGSVTVEDHRMITGTGFNIKAGAIFFPFEESAFRFGLSIATPTWYDLYTSSATALYNDAATGGTPIEPNFVSEGEYDYRVYTPWKFGFSLGHTIGRDIALGASYEFADYSSISSRVIDGYDYYGQTSSYKDLNMNSHTERSLKGVSTLKLGAEVKASPEFAIRLGYNFVSPMYRKDAYRDGTVQSLGTYYSSRADYTNWKATNRITCGVGYSKGAFSADLAYQYNVTNGDFKPFMDSEATYDFSDGTSEHVVNYTDAVGVSNKRHQVIATLTYKF